VRAAAVLFGLALLLVFLWWTAGYLVRRARGPRR